MDFANKEKNTIEIGGIFPNWHFGELDEISYKIGRIDFFFTPDYNFGLSSSDIDVIFGSETKICWQYVFFEIEEKKVILTLELQPYYQSIKISDLFSSQECDLIKDKIIQTGRKMIEAIRKDFLILNIKDVNFEDDTLKRMADFIKTNDLSDIIDANAPRIADESRSMQWGRRTTGRPNAFTKGGKAEIENILQKESPLICRKNITFDYWSDYDSDDYFVSFFIDSFIQDQKDPIVEIGYHGIMTLNSSLELEIINIDLNAEQKLNYFWLGPENVQSELQFIRREFLKIGFKNINFDSFLNNILGQQKHINDNLEDEEFNCSNHIEKSKIEID